MLAGGCVFALDFEGRVALLLSKRLLGALGNSLSPTGVKNMQLLGLGSIVHCEVSEAVLYHFL